MQTYQELFTTEEREIVEKCVHAEMFSSVVSALESASVFEMTPEKETALSAYLATFRPAPEQESAVRNELAKLEHEGFKIETQEQEWEWQAKLDAEKAAQEAAMRAESGTTGETVIETVEAAPAAQVETGGMSAEEMDEIEMTKLEIIEELKKRNIEFNPLSPKNKLAALLT